MHGHSHTQTVLQALPEGTLQAALQADILLLPGLNGSGRFHQPFISALAPELRCVALPLPAQGAQDYEFLLAYFAPLLTQRERPCAVLGESFSGPLVYELARRYPQKVRAVIWAASFVANPRPWLTRVPAAQWFIQIGRHLPPRPLYRIAFRRHDDLFWQVFLDERRQLNTAVWGARIRAVRHRRAPDQTLSQPCLYLQAAQDYLILPYAQKAVRKIATHLQIEKLRGSHLLLQSNPEQCAERVQAWMSSLPDRAAWRLHHEASPGI